MDASLNPALAEARFCPRCGQPAEVDFPRRIACAHRETDEELRIAIELGPLVGVYSRADDRVVLIVYRASALGQPQTTPEAVEVCSFALREIPWDELAFWSTERALRDAFPDLR